jgi:class 3 adenylate cyclase/tetratricopeptide (TPR) repeat protein
VRCPSCGEENPDRAKFCLNCATPLTAPAEPAGETRKVVTIVFADMVGSTAIGEGLDPEALRRVQARYFDAMAAVIDAHGGTVEKYIGDAVMAVFGIPRLHEDDPLRAVRAAAGMHRAIGELNGTLERDHGVQVHVRIGVHTGEVVTGDTSTGQRLVTGDTVNTAARLEQAADADGTLLSDTTFRLVKDAVRVEGVEPRSVKGKAEPLDAHRLLEVLPDTAGHERNLDSPMVGRAKELDLFRRALERAVDERTSHLFTLLGPAGVGKSRLVREFLAGAGDATVLRGRCLSYGEGITYYALAEVIRAGAGIAEGAAPGEVSDALRTALGGVEDVDAIAGPLSGALGAGEPASAEDTAWATRKFLEHLARERPVVVLIDDLHWAEPLLLDLVEHLADWTRDAALLLVCVARPELLEIRPGWGGGKMNATSILLEPLAGDEAGALLANLLGETDLPGAARDRILAAAEGNPLFVEEMVEMLIDDGLLRFEDGVWRAADDLANVTVPPTIQLLLAARLDRLDAEERAVIERGAVEGKVFHTGAVTSLAPEGLRAEVRPRLMALARKELIRPDRAEFAGEDAFRFRHLLIRDAAYHAMPKEQRADLHERFADWLERSAGDRAEEYVEITAHHLEQAYRYRSELGSGDDALRELGDRAARLLVVASERATARGDVLASVHFLERATEVASGDVRAAATVELAEMHEFRAAYAESLVLAEPLTEPGATSDERVRMRAELVCVVGRGQTDPSQTVAAATRRFEAIRERAERAGYEDLVDRSTLLLGLYAFFAGQAGAWRETALHLYPKRERLRFVDRRELGFGLGAPILFGPTTVAEGYETLPMIEELWGGSIVGRIRAGIVEASLASMRDDGRAYDEVAQRLEALNEELGETRNYQHQPEMESLWRLGRWDEAEALGRRAKRTYDEEGETAGNSTVTALLASYAFERGRPEEARELVADARTMAAEDDIGAWAPIRCAEALLASGEGDHVGALDAVADAERILEPTDYLCFQGDTASTKGWVLRSAGRDEEAEAAFDQAIALYERKGDVASANRLRERLAAS